MRTLPALLLVLAIVTACGETPETPAATTPAATPTAPTPPDQDPLAGVAPEATARDISQPADFVVELRQQDEFVVVLINGDARGVMEDDETWSAIEKILVRFVADDPEHENPTVTLQAAHTLDTKWIVRAVDRLIKIGIEDVTFSGRPPKAQPDASGGR